MATPEEQKILHESRERVAKHMAGLDGLTWVALSEEHRRIYRGDAGLALAGRLGPLMMGGHIPIAKLREIVDAAVKAVTKQHPGPAR